LLYTASKKRRPDHLRPRTGYGGNPNSVFKTPTPCNDTLRQTTNGARLGKSFASPRMPCSHLATTVVVVELSGVPTNRSSSQLPFPSVPHCRCHRCAFVFLIVWLTRAEHRKPRFHACVFFVSDMVRMAAIREGKSKATKFVSDCHGKVKGKVVAKGARRSFAGHLRCDLG
jgi:hypothetical protein